MPSHFDLAVIGGGPAGAAAALEASQQGRSVVLFERAGADADRPCGEGIMPAGVATLEELGLADVVARGRPFTGVRHVVWGARPLPIDLDRPGVAIRRTELQRALDDALARTPGVVRLEADVLIARTRGRFLADAGPVGRFTADVLVAADGSRGVAAPWLRRGDAAPIDAGRRRPSGRFGLRARFAPRGNLDCVEVHMGRGCEVYLTPLSSEEVNAVVLFERAPDLIAGVEALLDWALARHPAAAAWLGSVTTPPVARALPASRPRRVAGEGAFLAGDAVGAVDPILGCGVTIALRTGVAAARGAARLLAGDDAGDVARTYAKLVRRECVSRHRLASLLRLSDGHPRLARLVVATLGRVPSASRALARVAGGR